MILLNIVIFMVFIMIILLIKTPELYLILSKNVFNLGRNYFLEADSFLIDKKEETKWLMFFSTIKNLS